MTTRVLIINPMQEPPGVWLAPHGQANPSGSIAFKREHASTFASKGAAEIRAQMFAAGYPQRGSERLAFMYIESFD